MSMDMIRALTDTFVVDEEGQQISIKQGRTFRINGIQPVENNGENLLVMMVSGVSWLVKNKDWEKSAMTLS